MNRAERRREHKLARKPSNTDTPSSQLSLPDIQVRCQALLHQAIQRHQSGRLEEAQSLYCQVLDLSPDNADANHLLGVLNFQTGDSESAIALISKAIDKNPNDAVYYNNLGLALQERSRLDEAVNTYQQALKIRPDYSEAYCNLGNVFQEKGQLENSEINYLKALRINPNFAGAYYNLGNTFQKQQRLEEAIAAFEKAITFAPGYAKAHCNLGNAFNEIGRMDKAEVSLRKALALDPESVFYHSSVIFMQDFCPGIELAAQQVERKLWNEKFILPLAGKIKPHTNSRDSERRLRIGYVSADFRSHSACQGMGPLILEHDRNHFDVYCYAGNTVSDAMTETLR